MKYPLCELLCQQEFFLFNFSELIFEIFLNLVRLDIEKRNLPVKEHDQEIEENTSLEIFNLLDVYFGDFS